MFQRQHGKLGWSEFWPLKHGDTNLDRTELKLYIQERKTGNNLTANWQRKKENVPHAARPN